jgi:hypothetical protein
MQLWSNPLQIPIVKFPCRAQRSCIQRCPSHPQNQSLGRARPKAQPNSAQGQRIDHVFYQFLLVYDTAMAKQCVTLQRIAGEAGVIQPNCQPRLNPPPSSGRGSHAHSCFPCFPLANCLVESSVVRSRVQTCSRLRMMPRVEFFWWILVPKLCELPRHQALGIAQTISVFFLYCTVPSSQVGYLLVDAHQCKSKVLPYQRGPFLLLCWPSVSLISCASFFHHVSRLHHKTKWRGMST